MTAAAEAPSPLLDSLNLTPPQRQAAAARGRDVSVAAGAGSGKTRTLVARYLALLDGPDGLPPRAVAAITFTEKAAREMRHRIRAEAHRWRVGDCPPAARERWAEIEADVDAARIGTIHSLCAAIMRAHPAEAGVDPRFGVLDEAAAAALLAQVVADTLGWAVGQPELVPLFAAFTTTHLEAVLHRLVPARLEAQAMLGPDRLAPDPGAAWQRALAKALGDFVADEAVSSAISDLRGLAAGRQLEADAGPKLAPQVQALLAAWAEAEQALAGGQAVQASRLLFTIRREHCRGNVGSAGRARDAVKALREAYDEQLDPWLGGKEAGDPPPDSALEARAAGLVPLLGLLLQHALARYAAAKDLRQALDFDDLESGALELLRQAEVRARWQRQLQALLVDEFQDTNERQRQIVEALAGVAEGLAGRLFVVGDAKQSIYRFRGADVAVFQRLDRDIRARGGLPLELNETFRAHQGLVEATQEILGGVWAAAAGAGPQRQSVPFTPLRATRTEARGGFAGPYVEFLCGLGGDAEAGRRASARLLARRLAELHAARQLRWHEAALLFRASGAFPIYEAALEQVGIPFVTVAGRGFYDRPEVRDLLNLLRALADPWDDVALAGLLRSPAFGVSDAGLYYLRWADPEAGPLSFRQALARSVALAALDAEDRQATERARAVIERLARLVDRVPVAEVLKRVLDETHYPAILARVEAGQRLQRNVDKLLADAHASGLVRVTEFLDYVETLQATGAREGEAAAEAAGDDVAGESAGAGGAVRLMTVHRAKGLEFPVVVIADAARGRPGGAGPVLLSPLAGVVPGEGRLGQAPLTYHWARHAEQAREAAEDLRVLYVAATRAREMLLVCGHRSARASAGVWLEQLAAAAGLSLAQAAAQPGHWLEARLPRCGQLVQALAIEAEADDAERGVAPAEGGLAQTAPAPASAPREPEGAGGGGAAPLFAPLAEPVAEAWLEDPVLADELELPWFDEW